MGKIKPMRVVTPRIVQPGERSWLWLWMWLLVLVALAAWTWQVFEFGRQQAGFSVGQRDAMEAELMQRIEELAAERDALRSDAARFERAGQIDRAAADGVQAEVKALLESFRRVEASGQPPAPSPTPPPVPPTPDAPAE